MASSDSHQGYESLSSLTRSRTANSSHPDNSNQSSFSRIRTNSDQGGTGGAGTMSSSKNNDNQAQRPNRVVRFVRMASDLFTPAATSSSHRQDSYFGSTAVPNSGARSYGSINRPPAVTRGESALADDDEEEAIEDYVIWGHWKLILLTLGLAGAQLTWTIELGYGTPYLLSLGLSKELTSLVWLAGPLSGFIVQPLIGAVSDNSSSRYRRRRWVVYASVAIVISTLVLAFASEMATWLVDLLAQGQGDWDPKRNADIKLTSIGLAVASFYVLDFSLNGLQAALRALVLDLVPSEQQTAANAYLARMTNIGNIVGYGFGYLNLSGWIVTRWIGGSQFRKLCIVAIVVLIVCITVTCATNHEERLPKIKRNKSLRAVFSNIWNAAKDLPIPIRRICYVQLFAWSGFFPVMFYSTTWVAIRFILQHPDNPPDNDTATRAGSLSLLFQSIMAVLTSIILPLFSAFGASDFILSKKPSKTWNLTRWFLSWFTPRNIWTFSHLFFVCVMIGTFWAKTREQATVIVALLGVSWAITCWVPFAILMEFIREMEAGAELGADEVISASEIQAIIEEEEAEYASQNGSAVNPGAGQIKGVNASYLSPPAKRKGSISPSASGSRRRSRSGRSSISSSRRSSVRSNLSERTRNRIRKSLTECRPLIGEDREPDEPQQGVGGTILGIHNLAIVSPQFITAIVAAIIFKISAAASHHSPSGPSKPYGILSAGAGGGDGISAGGNGSDVVWVLRFGGLMTLVAVFLSRYVPAPPSEQLYIGALMEASNVSPYSEAGADGE